MKKLILIGLVLGLIVLSGCKEKPKQIIENWDEDFIKENKTEPPISSLEDNKYIEIIKNNLINEKITIKNIEIVNGRYNGSVKSVFLLYNSKSLTEEDSITAGDILRKDITTIVNNFLDTVNTGFDIDALMVLFGDQNGEYVGSWHLSKEWKEGYLNKKFTLGEIISKVYGTIERKEEPKKIESEVEAVFSSYGLDPKVVLSVYEYNYGMGVAIDIDFPGGTDTEKNKYMDAGLAYLHKQYPDAKNYVVKLYDKKWEQICEYKEGDTVYNCYKAD